MEKELQKRIDRYEVISHIAQYPFFSEDLARFVLGDYIGNGAYRWVFAYGRDKVIKLTHDTEANHKEYAVWQSVKETKFAKWFAPCIDISPAGQFLIQKKARKIRDNDKLPKFIPDFFTDLKRDNFGFIGKQFVCVDYQFIDRAIDASFYSQMRKLEFKH